MFRASEQASEQASKQAFDFFHFSVSIVIVLMFWDKWDIKNLGKKAKLKNPFISYLPREPYPKLSTTNVKVK